LKVEGSKLKVESSRLKVEGWGLAKIRNHALNPAYAMEKFCKLIIKEVKPLRLHFLKPK
jgi:hypothetical protein